MTCYVYIIAHEESGGAVGPVKVGVGGSPPKRLKALQTGNPKPLTLYYVLAVPDRKIATSLEETFHALQKEHQLMGEWFNIEPYRAETLLTLYLSFSLSMFTSISPADQAICMDMSMMGLDLE